MRFLLVLCICLTACSSNDLSKDPKAAAVQRFYDEARLKLEKSWSEERKTHSLGMKFEEDQKAWVGIRLKANGQVDRVEFKRRAESKELNKMIERAAFKAAPFPPPPASELEAGYFSLYWDVKVDREKKKE